MFLAEATMTIEDLQTLERVAQVETEAAQRLTTVAQAAAQALAGALYPGQTAGGYTSADGLLLGRDGRPVGDSREGALAFVRDLDSGLVARMAHDLAERAAESDRATEALRRATTAAGGAGAAIA
jgi:hypothetical protein